MNLMQLVLLGLRYYYHKKLNYLTFEKHMTFLLLAELNNTICYLHLSHFCFQFYMNLLQNNKRSNKISKRMSIKKSHSWFSFSVSDAVLPFNSVQCGNAFFRLFYNHLQHFGILQSLNENNCQVHHRGCFMR